MQLFRLVLLAILLLTPGLTLAQEISGGSITATISGTADVEGTGTAGTPAGGVLSVQGVGSGTALPVTGTITAVTTVGTITNPVTAAQATAANLNATVVGTGTFAVQSASTLAAETTKVIGTVRMQGNVGGVVDAVKDAAIPANAIMTGGTNGTNLTVPYIDPCQRGAKVYYPVDIVTATTTEIANADASNKFYFCSIFLFSAGTQNVTIVEDDSDTCASPTAGIIGGVTAAEGPNLTAQTGFTLGNGQGAIAATSVVNRYICIITSAAVQLSGVISYAAFP